MTEDQPEGLSVLISEKIEKQYAPKDIISAIEMEAELAKVWAFQIARRSV